MQAITAVIRPEKCAEVMEALSALGHHGLSHWRITGRGKQKGIQLCGVIYDELPKEVLYIVVEDEAKTNVVTTIIKTAKSGPSGKPGDGRIFITPVTEAYTISKSLRDF